MDWPSIGIGAMDKEKRIDVSGYTRKAPTKPERAPDSGKRPGSNKIKSKVTRTKIGEGIA